MRALCFVVLIGCSIPNTQFAPSVDADHSDALQSDVLAIVPSVTSVSLDENRDQQFTVRLTRAPSAPLSVRVETTSTKLGLSEPQLDFTETNFDQPQAITVTGLADVDVADETATIQLAAAGLDPVELAAAVHDTDVLAIVTDVPASNMVTLDEGASVDVRVRLSHKPAADVSVGALLATGSVTVTPSSLVFTPQNYSTEKTFRFTAAQDANVTNDDIALTLRMGTTDRLYTVRAIDDDTLNISVSPSSLALTEQGSGRSLSVALTQQPSSDVTVAIGAISGNVTTSKNSLTFTPQNYAMTQTVTVTAGSDPDTDDDTDTVQLSATGVTTREVGVAIADDDAQEILESAPTPFTVAENGTNTFGVKLKFQPAGSVTVQVTSNNSAIATATPGVLTFDATNYNTEKTVTVRGTDDNNLATNSTDIKLFNAAIGTTLVRTDVTDDDQQQLVVSSSTLAIAEGTSDSFNVTLMYDPGTTVTATVANTNAAALPSSPSSLTFTTANWNQPHAVTVSPPVDSNNVGETATITISGAGAANTPTVAARVTDGTVVQTWGWPSPFGSTNTISAGYPIAYKIDVGAVAKLDSFHTYVPTAVGLFRMALYTDTGTGPGLLVAEMPAGVVLQNGVNNGPIALDPQLASPSYYLVIRFSADVNIGYAGTSPTGRMCYSGSPYGTIDESFAMSFGAATCSTQPLHNVWIATYHQ